MFLNPHVYDLSELLKYFLISNNHQKQVIFTIQKNEMDGRTQILIAHRTEMIQRVFNNGGHKT